jgi:hypothetical protein
VKTTFAVTVLSTLGLLGGGVADIASVALAAVLIVAIVVTYLMLVRGIAPHVKWGPFTMGFKRLPKERPSDKAD